MGFRPPPRDGRHGGDGRFDVYLKDLGSQGLYGYCAPEYRVPGLRQVASGYCVLDDDFARRQYGANPKVSLRVTAAHEFFHADPVRLRLPRGPVAAGVDGDLDGGAGGRRGRRQPSLPALRPARPARQLAGHCSTPPASTSTATGRSGSTSATASATTSSAPCGARPAPTTARRTATPWPRCAGSWPGTAGWPPAFAAYASAATAPAHFFEEGASWPATTTPAGPARSTRPSGAHQPADQPPRRTHRRRPARREPPGPALAAADHRATHRRRRPARRRTCRCGGATGR